ncbi:hypothetical protein C8J56DRAFT_226206 [Mycena floridula]|nr:hypothetical protein C8J56DRAFT_226206 [Mycena floridula]
MELPLPLILLIHLQILEYPKLDDAHYDLDMFNRDLRDRTKVMEDVCYFLIRKLEGNRTKLPRYPCLAPNEKLVFRVAVTKYLESLRRKNLNSWWRDVVVRKSLLDDCLGTKFERIMVALSTQVLFQVSNGISEGSPATYSTKLSSMLSARQCWIQSASSLLHRQHQYVLSREQMTRHEKPKYASLTTENLVALSSSKSRDARVVWSGEQRRALSFLIDLAGIVSPEIPGHSATIANPKIQDLDIASLPVAAVHHPSHLRMFRRSIFSDAQKAGPLPEHQSQPCTMLVIQLETAARTNGLLHDAIRQVQQSKADLHIRLENRDIWSPPATTMSLWRPEKCSTDFLAQS